MCICLQFVTCACEVLEERNNICDTIEQYYLDQDMQTDSMFLLRLYENSIEDAVVSSKGYLQVRAQECINC